MNDAGELFYRLPETRDGAGYTMVTVPGGKGRKVRTHRLRWEILHQRRVPSGHVVRHLNDNKGDERPDNLALGIQADNMRDAHRNGRRGGLPGLTEEAKADIRARRARKESLRSIGDDYGLSPQRVCDIAKGR